MDPNSSASYLLTAQLLQQSSSSGEGGKRDGISDKSPIQFYRKALALEQSLEGYEGLVQAYLSQGLVKEAFSVAGDVFKRAPVPRTMTLMALVIQHLPGRQDEVSLLNGFVDP